MKFPKKGTIWYIESKSGPDNWFRIMYVTGTTNNPTNIYYKTIDGNGGDWKDSTGKTSLKGWHEFNPKNVTKNYPEYLL